MNLFVYGTLMDDDVWQSLGVREYDSSDAVLYGYERKKLRSVSYPAIRRYAAGAVNGRVFWDVDVDDLIQLDAFEGDEYCRKMMRVKVNDTFVKAFVYEIKPEFEHELTNEEWFLHSFQNESKSYFMKRYRGYFVDV